MLTIISPVNITVSHSAFTYYICNHNKKNGNNTNHTYILLSQVYSNSEGSMLINIIET